MDSLYANEAREVASMDVSSISEEELDMVLGSTLSPWRLSKQIQDRFGPEEALNLVGAVRGEDGEISSAKASSLLLSSGLDPKEVLEIIRMSRIEP